MILKVTLNFEYRSKQSYLICVYYRLNGLVSRQERTIFYRDSRVLEYKIHAIFLMISKSIVKDMK